MARELIERREPLPVTQRRDALDQGVGDAELGDGQWVGHVRVSRPYLRCCAARSVVEARRREDAGQAQRDARKIRCTSPLYSELPKRFSFENYRRVTPNAHLSTVVLKKGR